MDDYIYYLLTLTIDGLTTLYFSTQYLAAKKLFATFTKSLEKGINQVDTNEEGPQYVVVRGNVKSIGPPIKSLNKPFTSGVIQKLLVKEFVAEKATFGMWINQERIIDRKCNVVPFELKNGKFNVTITSPLEASYLDLEVVEDRFEPSVSSLLGLLFGVHQKGIQHTEYLLKEKSILTGFGEVVVEKDGLLQLIPPKNGMSYILTTMDPETLVHELSSEKKFYGVCCVIFSTLGVIVAAVLTYKFWKVLKRKKRMRELSAAARSAENERRRNAAALDLRNDSFICIICCINPREVVLLPCGHISMCADCAYQSINAPCPVCRQHVADTNLIYIS